jgi:hypothetical protein
MPHTLHHLCMSQFSPTSLVMSHWFVDIKQNTIIASFYKTEGAKAYVPLNKKGAAPCWQWGSPTHETHRVAYVTSVKHSQHLQTPHSPAVVMYIHSLTLPLQPESTYRRRNSKSSLILYFTHFKTPYYCKVPKHRSRSKWCLCCCCLTNSLVRHVVVTNGREMKLRLFRWPSKEWRHISWQSGSWQTHTDSTVI